MPAVLLALLVLAVYVDPLFLRRVFSGRDPIAYHYPVEHAIHDAYSRGRLPVWMPEISGGRPLLANPNVGALYPVRPLLSLVPFPSALRVFPVLHWIAAGMGMLLLLRILGVSPAGSWIGAVTYVFSGVSVSHVFYPNLHPGLALLPWLVWALARWRSGVRAVLAVALVLALLLLAGDPFSVVVSVIAVAVWLLLEVEAAARVPAATALALAVVLAGLVAAPQIVAAAGWIPETNRAVLGLKVQDVLLFSVSPMRLLELIVPYPFGPTWEVDATRVWGSNVLRQKSVGFFTSLHCGALAVIAVVAARNGRGRGTRFFRVLLLVTLAFCVLPSLVPTRWGGAASPLPLRYPEKFAAGMVFALSALTGIGADILRSRAVVARWTLAVGATLAGAALFSHLLPDEAGRAAATAVRAEPRSATIAGALFPGALAEAGLLWMVTVVALALFARRRRVETAVALALFSAVPILANRRIAQTDDEQRVLAPTAFARRVKRADPEGAFRVLGASAYRVPSRLEASQQSSDFGQVEVSRRNWYHYTQALWGYGTLFNHDFDAGDFSRLESLRRVAVVAAGFRDADSFFAALSLRWAIRYRDEEPYPGYRRFGGDALQDWDELPAALPDVRLLTAWREEPDAVMALKALPRLAPGELVIETGVAQSGRAGPAEIRVIEKTPERIRFDTTSREPAWVFVLRSFWLSRTVTRDGREVSPVPAQLAFTALPVPPGRHRFEWKESAPGWPATCWVTVFALGCAAVLVVAEGARKA